MRAAMVCTFLALAIGTSPAAFTGALDGFQSNLAAASADLSGSTDPDSIRRKRAVDRSLVAVLAFSPSLAKDMTTAVKVARLLEKAYPPEDALLGAFDGVVDGLEVEVVEVRDQLAAEALLLPARKRAAAEAGLASVDGLLVLAEISSTRAGRTSLLKKAERRAFAARRSLRRGARAGFQGPVNGSFEGQGASASEAAFWDHTGSHPRFGNPSVYRLDNGTAANGTADMYMNGENWAFGSLDHRATLSQDNVLLSRSRRLLFDYGADVFVPSCTSGANLGDEGVGRLEVLFSLDDPAVLVPLWSRDFPVGDTIESVAGQVVELPFLSSPGTLIFRVTTTYVLCDSLGTYSDVNIRIDNVRVE